MDLDRNNPSIEIFSFTRVSNCSLSSFISIEKFLFLGEKGLLYFENKKYTVNFLIIVDPLVSCVTLSMEERLQYQLTSALEEFDKSHNLENY